MKFKRPQLVKMMARTETGDLTAKPYDFRLHNNGQISFLFGERAEVKFISASRMKTLERLGAI